MLKFQDDGGGQYFSGSFLGLKYRVYQIKSDNYLLGLAWRYVLEHGNETLIQGECRDIELANQRILEEIQEQVNIDSAGSMVLARN